MTKSNKIYSILFCSSFLYVLIKYFASHLELPDERLIVKILSFSSDTEYFYLAESFSRLDFSTDWSKIEISKKIIGFPIFSIIWHSIFFKFFGYYSFLFLEIILLFTISILIFLILRKFEYNDKICLLAIFFLFILIQLIEIGILSGVNYSNLLLKLGPINEFIGERFPRPIITSVYAFIIIYNLIILTDKNLINSKLNIFLISIFLSFLINSFFHLFIVLFLLTIYSIIKLLFEDYSVNFKKNNKILLFFSLVIFIGLIFFSIQQYLSEDDYANRIGVYYITTSEKIFLIKEFLRIFIQIEYIALIILSFVFRLYFNLKIKNKIIQNRYDVLFLFFIFSLLSPILFIVFTNKVIVLHHFLTIVKFSCFFYLFVSILRLININLKNYILLLSFIILQFLVLSNYFIYSKKENYGNIKDVNQVYLFLKKNNYTNTDMTLFGTEIFNHLWFNLKNKYISIPNGFPTSHTDEQLENLIFYTLKTFNIKGSDFDKILNDRKCGRECFANHFSYKYAVSSLKKYKPFEKEYTYEDQQTIKNISPIEWWYTIIPKSEKQRLKNRFDNLIFNKKYSPELIILNKKNKFLKGSNILEEYKLVFTNKSYDVFVLKNY